MGKLHYIINIITFSKYLPENKEMQWEESAKYSTAEWEKA